MNNEQRTSLTVNMTKEFMDRMGIKAGDKIKVYRSPNGGEFVEAVVHQEVRENVLVGSCSFKSNRPVYDRDGDIRNISSLFPYC
jgi:formylmethanofuran dehydrogenase subunit D